MMLINNVIILCLEEINVNYGYVRDIADWYISDKLNHKIDTIYALVYSLYQADMNMYAQLLLR